jgi:hypothetical protein
MIKLNLEKHGSSPNSYPVFLLIVTTYTTSALEWGAPCDGPEACEDDLANLVCSPEGSCIWIGGYTTNRNGACRKTYGEECEMIVECNIDRYLTCDTVTKTCACQQPMIQTMIQHCVSLQNAKCDMTTDNEGNVRGNFFLHCVDKAYCDNELENGVMRHICECSRPYVPTKDRLCEMGPL